MSRILLIVLSFIALTLVQSDRVRAATYVVTSAADIHDPIPGDGVCGDPNLPDSLRCTFRAAVEEANADVTPDTIRFAPALPTIYLSLGTVTISRNRTVIDGQNQNPVLDGLMDPFFSTMIVLSSDSNVLRGVTVRRARFHGVAILGSLNCIGDSTGQSRTLFVSNGIDRTSSAAVYIGGARARDNLVVGCRVGLNSGGELLPNQNGIVLDSATSGNTIGGSTTSGRNLICGNSGYGVKLANGANHNLVHNCFMGPDGSGLMGFANVAGGLLLDTGAYLNRVGGTAAGDRNLISLNSGPGITIRGPGTNFNTVAGNVIGLDVSGEIGIGNQSGILIADGAQANIIGGLTFSDRNVISGNSGDGIRIVGNGTFENRIIGNFIGTDTSGYSDIGNGLIAGDGVFISDGAGRTTIGGAEDSAANVISGNPHAGICLSGSAQNNILGNFIGVSIGSISSCPNGTGILIEKRASGNSIGGPGAGEGNTISGNRADLFPNGAGIAIYDPGTAYNRVLGNMIGTDITGTRSLRNGSCGVIIGNGAQHNQVGGPNPGERNVISGNGAGSVSVTLGAGVHVFGDGTAYNQICGNYIGVSSNGLTPILNFGNGVGIYNGANHNLVGGATAAEGNLIVGSPMYGIFESGNRTVSNSFLNDLIYDNDSLGIAVRVPGSVIPKPPTLTNATTSIVEGTQAPPLGRIQIYKATGDPSGYGQGMAIIGAGSADSTGSFALAVSGVVSGDFVSAIATDTSGSSSEFALNRQIDAPTSADNRFNNVPKRFALEQNFPNPFNPSTEIRFSLPHSSWVSLKVINIQGEQVISLIDRVVSAGVYQISWDGRNEFGQRLASGVYFYRLAAGDFIATRKMLFLK